MTLDKFIAALEKTPRDWHIESDGVIRTGRNECPACKVSNEIKGTRFALAWEDAAFALSMSMGDCRGVADAADDEPDHDPELRARLLKACGLAP